MDDLLELTMTFDFYGDLLTVRQKRIFELYYMDDYSLQEIADNFSISKQAVSDQLAKVKIKLQRYEDRVGYINFYRRLEKILVNVHENPAVSDEIKTQLKKLMA